MSCACITVLSTESQWDAIEHQWDELFQASPYAAAPLRFFWLRHWWRIYRPAVASHQDALRIVCFWQGEQLIGVLPLYESARRAPWMAPRRLCLLSSGEPAGESVCADYLNLLCRSGHEADCLAQLPGALTSLDWDVLEWLDLAADSPLAALGIYSSYVSDLTPRSGCPVADLTGGFEAYLGRLSANTRQNARRQLRAAAKAGASFELATSETCAAVYDELIRLHQQRWTEAGKPGCFASRRFTEFHRGLVREWIGRGYVVLARLKLGDECLAVLYGFVTGDKFDFYQSGVRHLDAGPVASAGITAHLLLMQHLAQRGITCYDFLRGNESYKARLATGEHLLVGLRVCRPTLTAAAWRSRQSLERMARRWLKPLQRKSGRASH